MKWSIQKVPIPSLQGSRSMPLEALSVLRLRTVEQLDLLYANLMQNLIKRRNKLWENISCYGKLMRPKCL